MCNLYFKKSLILSMMVFIKQIKRCGEMARKLRFFREQMARAGLSPSSNSLAVADFDLDNLEVVRYIMWSPLFFFLPLFSLPLCSSSFYSS